MAYDYNKAKQAWEMMDDNQKKQYTEQNKNDANFQQFAQQYHNETQGSSNGSVNQNNTVNNTQGTNTQPTTQSNQNQTNQNGTTYDFSNNHSTLSDGRNGNGNFYGNTQFDREEQFDKSMIGDTKGVTIQEGTGKDTGRPDYQIDTDARLNEMRNNLNQYYQTNPEWFQDRETFNRQFEYNQRESDAQRALLDSYWKKAQDMRTVNNYTNGDSVMAGFNNYDITPDQMSLLRQYNPEAYAQRQKQMQDELNARITNLAAPRDVWDTVDLWGEIVKKLGIEAGDPYDIYGTWYNMAEQLGVFRDSQQLASMSNNIASIYATMNSNVQNISSQLEGRYSAGYIEARINKANSRLNSQASSMQYSYNLLLQKRNQNMAIAQQAGAMKQAQGQEDSRVFNNKLQALKFAMTADSYRTPEQQAGLRLQEESIRNDMNLLDQAKKNDLALYNQYATARMQNQLNYEMQDLTVTDPKQLRANLSNVLDQYYDTYGSMIQRSKDQVINDVINYAKKNGVSVGQALSENFIKPLQSKPQYQALLNKSTGYDPYQNQESWTYSVDGNGDVSYSIKGYGTLPSNLSRGERRNIYSDIFNQSGNDASWSALGMSTAINDGSYTGQCGAFVNDWLVSIGEQGIFGDSLESKTKYATESEPVVGSVFIMDSPTKGANGHVGIVVGKNEDGTLEVVDSNWKGDGTKQSHKLDPKQYNIYGYYYPKSLKIQGSGYYDPNLTDFFGKSSASFSSTQWNAIKDAGYTTQEYNQMKSNYAAEVGKKITDNENLLLTDMYKLKNMGKTGYKAFQYGLGIFPGTKIADYNSWYNTITASAALKNLVDLKGEGATFGALSDNELAFITDSSKIFNKDQTYDEFMTNLNKTISDLEAGIKARGGKVDLTANAKNSSEYAQYLFPTVQISNNNTGLSTGLSFILKGNR